MYKDSMTLILDDALRLPHAFCWFGAIPAAELDAWTQRTQIQLPPDLLEFWRITGGGDLFETETILRPSVESAPNQCFVIGDDTESFNEALKKEGMAPNLFVFQQGCFLSAIDLPTAKYVTLSSTYAPQSEFKSLEEWYLETLRPEFAPRYGLD